MNSSLKKALPHLIAIVVFVLIAVVYCQPAFQGKVVNQSDIQGWKGMAQQSFEYKEKYGHIPYWITSMFSGMPGYQTVFESDNPFSIVYLHKLFTLGLPKPANFFFLACLMTYFLFMVLRTNPWVGVMGAVAYAYATFDPIIVSVGHDTQMICIAYAPAVIGSILLIFQKRYIAGTALTALFAALMLSFNHLQIIYYTLITALCIAVAFAVHTIRSGNWKHVAYAAALALLAGGIAVGVNTVSLWPTSELVKETMRGGRSELTDTTAHQSNKTKGGLDKDYAFQYSYGIDEVLTVIVPNLYGGGSAAAPFSSGGSKFADRLAESGIRGMSEEENALRAANSLAYWGDQSGTAGAVYLGAVICFLLIAGMVYVKHWLKWGVFAACLIGFVLAWGKNFSGLNYFLFDHLPLYNKFRAPSMALVMPQLGFVIIAGLAVQTILFGNYDREGLWKRFRQTGFITLGVIAVLALLYGSFSYKSKNDSSIKQNISSMILQQQSNGQQPTPQLQQQAEEMSRSMMKGLEDDRQGLYGKDLLRSLFFILLAAASIYLFIKKKIQPAVALGALVLLSSIDLLAAGKRYLNADSFVEPDEYESVFTPSPADNQIDAYSSQHPKEYFRVFDQTAGDPFQDSRASYHHNSIGGYNPAKLALYQDIIQRQLARGNERVYNMLNTKFFITQDPATRQPVAQLNPGALGNAWFVKNISFAKNADEEMNRLNDLNTRDSAVIDQRYKGVAGSQTDFDGVATIETIEHLNDKITYKSSSAAPQFAVFSEVYYPYGWDAYIDGKKAAYARVNYILRGMPVPAGNHTIEFRFEPRSVILGDKITMWFSILVYLLLVAVAVLEWKAWQKQERLA